MDFSILTSYAAVIVYAIGICTFEALFFIYIGPRFTKKAIMKGLKGEEGKAIMREIVMSALASLHEEIEVAGEPDEHGKPTVVKTTLGDVIMGEVASAVVYHFKMTFLGEKGRLSKELNAAGLDLALSQLPAELQPLMTMVAPMMKKHPALGAIMALGAMMAQKAIAQNTASLQGQQAGGAGFLLTGG